MGNYTNRYGKKKGHAAVPLVIYRDTRIFSKALTFIIQNSIVVLFNWING